MGNNGEMVKPAPVDPSVDISIIIVSWNVSQLLKACLKSIFENPSQLNLQVIVVDSGSADDTCSMLRTHYPEVKLFDMQKNVGFPAGNNIGIQAAVGRNIYLLNPDTEIVGDALQVMLTRLESEPSLGMIGAKLLFPNGDIQSSRRRFPTVMTGMFESTWFEPLAPKQIINRYRMTDKNDEQPCLVDWVMGASMFASRAAVEATGGMDEDYVMYSEELDWCRRIKNNRFGILWFPSAEIIHHMGASSDQASTLRHINFNRAKLRYFRKYHGAWASGLIRIALIKNFVFQLLLEGAKWVVGHRRDLRKQRIGAYWQVLKTGLKPAGY